MLLHRLTIRSDQQVTGHEAEVRAADEHVEVERRFL
jgi:hypothetical protein